MKMVTLKLCYKQYKEKYQINNIITIQKWEIKMAKQFVIIFGIMVFKYQKNGKIINIRIHKNNKMDGQLLWDKP